MNLKLAIVKLASFVLHKLGRGGSFPGQLALKMDPDFIARFHMPEIVILVTGTNGKTTTQNLLAEALRASGLKVINNRRGDNLNVGIASLLASNSDLSFHVKADAAVIEVDELTVYRQFKNLRPSALVVTNFFRDQLDRAGEMETIILKIMEVTKDFTGHLILNGNDPNVLRIGMNATKAKVHYFAVDETKISRKTTDEASEGKFCPICGNPLHYRYYQYSHIGSFYCEHDGFGKVPYDVEVSDVDFHAGTFTTGNRVYHSFINTIYAIYNCAAVLTALKVFDIDPQCADEVLKYIISREGRKNICIILNDNDQDGRDVSWIWDAHFERLSQGDVKQIVCSGLRAYDMALRLKYEGLEDKIIVIEDLTEAVKWLDQADLDSYMISTYTALHPVRAILKKEEHA